MYALIVEPQLRRAAQYVAAVEEAGLDPALVRSDEEARRVIAERGSPALCLIELSGAGVDGFRLLTELKASGLRVPTVVVSAFAALRDTAWGQRDSFSIAAVLTTDLAPEALRSAVRVALGRGSRSRRPPEVGVDHGEEAIRLARLEAAGLAHAVNSSAALDGLIADLPAMFGVEAAVCTVLLADREVVVAHAGLAGRFVLERGTSREHSIGRHVVEAVGGAVLVLEDALLHPTFSDNLLVREGAVRGFVGVPLLSAGGTPLGVLCLLDSQPFVVSEGTLGALLQLAQRLSGEIALLPGSPPPPVETSVGRQALETFAVLIQSLDVPVVMWSPSGHVRVANRALSDTFGLPSQTFLGVDRIQFAEILAPLVRGTHFADLLRSLPLGPTLAEDEIELLTGRNQVFRWATKPVPLPEGMGQIDLWTDLTAERALIRAALMDGLTNLANRRGGEGITRRELARAEREGAPLSFLLLDIDNFKRVNDSRGHATGDVVIRGVAAAIERGLRASDAAARWGGEEFLVVLPDTDLAEARLVAERVRAAVAQAEPAPGVRVTVSVGCAQLEPGESAEAAIGRADARLYQAKDQGRDRVVAGE